MENHHEGTALNERIETASPKHPLYSCRDIYARRASCRERSGLYIQHTKRLLPGQRPDFYTFRQITTKNKHLPLHLDLESPLLWWDCCN